MELLISILIVTSISTFIAVFWVRGINYMHENHPDYKGEDLFDEDLNKNKQTYETDTRRKQKSNGK
jgi:hypothetical protein